ncbi:MAG: M6 family metalloprotease domain-containing protein [Paludibacteraceae bacterium]
MKRFAVVLLILIASFQAKAVPAYPYPVKMNQPDGTTLNVRLRGDEFYHFYTTEDGYLIVKNNRGFFNYAKQDVLGKLIDTHLKAKDVNLRSNSEKLFISDLKPGMFSASINQPMRSKRILLNTVSPQKRVYPKTGSPKALVILTNFSDVSFVTSTPQTAFTNMLNQQGYSDNGGTGSARDYFRDNSDSTFSPQFDVVGPVTLPQTLAYYGTNDANGKDTNAVQMVVDACAAADKNGVDFTQYDVDNDGIIDNVFVYYAGYNEAEHGPAETIWPHRWGVYPVVTYGSNGNYDGNISSVTFDHKRVVDYACTSELRGNTGSNMAGIGTFTHEFGHVLGLADMYPTDGGTYQTLSYWDIMDSGAYLNLGRTPPSYNSFERFQLGFMKPDLLQYYPQNVSLNPLNRNNKAYLISPTETHNLDGTNPSPAEFFLLENRQRTGWDAYLPGKGMLIYRINYNQNDWDYNKVNNDSSKMDVDIMEADGIASVSTLSGDPFPGTSNKLSYDLVLGSGTKLYKRINNITETNGIIVCNVDKVVAIETLPDSLTFSAEVPTSSAIQNVIVTTANITASELSYSIIGKDSLMFASTGGNGKLSSTGGTIYLSFTPVSDGVKQAYLIITDGTVEKLVKLIGNATYPPLAAPVVPSDPTTITVDNSGFTAVWTPVTNAESYTLNVYSKPPTGAVIPIINSPFSIIGNSFYVSGLKSDSLYFYQVAAIRGSRVSPLSAEVGPIRIMQTGLSSVKNEKLIVWKKDNTILIIAKAGEIIELFDIAGQKIGSEIAIEGVNEIKSQPYGTVIVRVGNRVGKVVY